MPASRIALFGCLGVIGLLVIAVVIFAVAAPDKARAIAFGTPTPPPATRRPTLTPSPVPSPTPRWPSHEGGGSNFSVDLPEYWVVVDYEDPQWKRRVDHKTNWYSWLAREYFVTERQQEAENDGLRAYDPRRMDFFSAHIRLAPDLAGMSVAELKSYVGQELQRQGGSSVRAYDVELDGRPAARLEFTVTPVTDTPNDQDIEVHLYLLADESRGFWIEIRDLEADLTLDRAIINAMVSSFRVVTSSSRQDG